MNARRGFSIVELMIVIVIMGILLVLAVVNLRSTQVNARDAERRSDVETIGRYLEQVYTSGYGTTATTKSVRGSYLGTTQLDSDADIQSALPDASLAAFTAPGATGFSVVPATNTNTSATGVIPKPTISTYVYQPFKSNNSLCASATDGCAYFYIYYCLEADNTVYRYDSMRKQ